jgi:hypothetical protein
MIIIDDTGNEFEFTGKVKMSFPEYKPNDVIFKADTAQIADMLNTFFKEHTQDTGIPFNYDDF